MKKGNKERQLNKVDVTREWVVKSLTSPRSERAEGNDNSMVKDLVSDLEDRSQSENENFQGAKPEPLLFSEFINGNPEGAHGRLVKKLSRDNGVKNQGCLTHLKNGTRSLRSDAVNQAVPDISSSGQCTAFSNEHKSCDVSERVQAAKSRNTTEIDVISETEVSMQDCSAVGSSDNSNFRREEEDKNGNLCSIIKRLKKLSLAINEPELSESQVELNDQEQEDEVLALKAIYEDDVFVVEREDGSPRALKMSIYVELPENIAITVRLPSTSSKCELSGNSSRSSSKDVLVGNVYTFNVQHLLPIALTCVLPKSYPCYMPPQFMILAYWLDSDSISKLCNSLDNIWAGESGQVVLYKWAEWLHSSSLSHLGFQHEILLDPLNMQSKTDWRAISGFSSLDVDIPRLMQYNDEKKNQLFCSTLHVCPICFNEYPGAEFVKLRCQHIFCRTCMETYSHVHVKDGTVNKLNCPDPKCEVSIPPNLLKKLLGDEAFERWESLLLQKTLDSMIDVVYCPRCESVCLEDEDHHAQCAKCFYSFCSLCRERRHVGQTCLTPEMRLRVLQERQNLGQMGSEQRKKEQELINELLSVNQILRDAKQCPSCKMAISKTEGCNKMTCYNCGQYFCYRCSKAVDGYDHFSGGNCILFEQEDIQNWERAMNDRQLELLARVELWPHLGRPCPNCGQLNAKLGNNNHIFCWSCQNHYCALCRKVVRRSSEHYGPRGCKQHTAD